MTDWRFAIAVARDRSATRVENGIITSGTASRYLRLFEAFGSYALADGVADPGSISAELCRRFIASPLRGHLLPSGSTGRLRLAAIRDAFDALVAAGFAAENPALGLRLDRQPSVSVPCPLTPGEAERLLAAGRLFATDTLRPACVALALAGATHVEVARAVVADLDPDRGGLRLGSAGCERIVVLGAAATGALAARVGALRREWRRRQSWTPQWVPLAMYRPVSAYRAESVAPTVSMNLSRALRRAGVTRDGVRPRSCREYAAKAVYARTGRVEDVAQQLGIGSLDAAYRLVDRRWQQQWGQGSAWDARLG